MSSTPAYVKGTTRLPEFVIPTGDHDIQNESFTIAQEEFVNSFMNLITSLLNKLSELQIVPEPGRCVLVLPLMSQWAMFIAEAVVRECFSSLTSFLVGQDANSRIVICHEDLIQRKIMQDALASLQLDVGDETKIMIDSPINDAVAGVLFGEVDEESKEGLALETSKPKPTLKTDTNLPMHAKFIAIRILDKPTSSDLEEVRSYQPEPDSIWTILSHLHILDILSATGPVYIMKPDWTGFGAGSDISFRWDSGDMDHALELFDFPSTFAEFDIIQIFKDFEQLGFAICWTDDTHAVIRFASKEIATQALSSIRHPSLKCRPVSVASRKTKLMLVRSPDRRLPYKRRPQTESKTAKRLILSSLGIRREPGGRGGKETN